MGFGHSLSRELRYELKRALRRLGGPVVQISLVVALVVGATTLYISPPGRGLETLLERIFFAIRGPRPVSDQVVLVAIDDVSFARLGVSPREPMPRRYVAGALDVVREAAPQLVIIDANIPPERTVDPDADARLASVLREGPFAIWSGATPEQQGEPYGSVTIASDELFRRAVRMELPMTLFAEGGDVIYIGDPSVGVSAPLESQVWMARPLREIAGRAINRPGRFDLINFYGPPGTIPRISLSALLQEDQRAHLQETVRGKIVIVGYQSLHYGRSHLSKDEVPVPVSNRGMFGVEVHATVAANLLDGSWLRRFDLVNELLFVILVVLILGSIVVRSPRPRTLVGALIAYVVMVCAGYLLFSKYNVWLAGLPTIGVSIGMMFVVSSCYFLVRSESYRRYIDATFSFKREKEF